MNDDQHSRVLDWLAFMDESKKTFDAEPDWLPTLDRNAGRLSLVVGLRTVGVLRGPI